MNLSKLIIGSILFAMVVPTFAVPLRLGGVSDGGGNSVVCRNEQGQITSAEFLDIYEAKHMHSLTPRVTGKGYLEIAREVAKRIQQGMPPGDPTIVGTESSDGVVTKKWFQIADWIQPGNFLQEKVESIDARKKILTEGVALQPVNDFDLTIIPKDCKIEQTAVYRDNNGQIFVVGDIWEKLDELNKAALLVHEALYKSLRGMGDRSSNRARLVIGFAFTNYDFKWVLDGVPSKDLFRCNSKDEAMDWRMLLYPYNEKWAVLQFLRIEGRQMITKAAMGVPMEITPLAAEEIPYSYSYTGDLNVPIEEDPSIHFFLKKDHGGTKSFRIGVAVGHTNLDELPELYCERVHGN